MDIKAMWIRYRTERYVLQAVLYVLCLLAYSEYLRASTALMHELVKLEKITCIASVYSVYYVRTYIKY